ncbi:MAG: DUF2325 domain-containing protein [Methylophilaceae bacterium]|nr:DUF2325 domain-containing protein [Methylophilaceae bacterium]
MSTDLMSSASSRRPRLWELNQKCHCPVIGVCFGMDEIRKLVGKVMNVSTQHNDFDIHVTAVCACETRTRLSSLLHKELERKYKLYIQRYNKVKDVAGLLALWREAMNMGDIAGPMWAIFSHACCTEQLLNTVYGDVHMLQHQVGAGHRVEQQAHLRLVQENAILSRELADIQNRFTQYRDERVLEVATLNEQLTAFKNDMIFHENLAKRHNNEVDHLREMLADMLADVASPEDNLRLVNSLRNAESENLVLKTKLDELEMRLVETEAANHLLETELAHKLMPENEKQVSKEIIPINAVPLNGCTVLCVGGMGNATPRYRKLVENRGGVFIHHDGGIEENINRLKSVLAAADAVICQTGCISHNAYWRVKEQCKRTGKACSFVANPSLNSFLQVLDELATQRSGLADAECASLGTSWQAN